jgi:hypothetical protein
MVISLKDFIFVKKLKFKFVKNKNMKKSFLLFLVLALFISKHMSAQVFQIGHTTITYTDPSRSSRSIATEIYYPTVTTGTSVPVSAGTFPVIVFGFLFSNILGSINSFLRCFSVLLFFVGLLMMTY